MRTHALLESLPRDLSYALRTLRKSPVFAATAILTLALAIGGNTAMFTVLHAVLLKPLEYRDPERLVNISGGATPLRFDGIKTGAHSLAQVGAFTGQENLAFLGPHEPEVLTGARVSANFLQILGVAPLLGRSFSPNEDSAAGSPVAMISAELWRKRFDRDPRILGKTATLEGKSYTVIGVLPPAFEFPYPKVDVWLTAPAEWSLIAPESRALSPFLSVFGRLRPGVPLQQANAELVLLRHRYALAHPAMLDAKSKSPQELRPMKEQLVANVCSMLWMLFGAVGFVLLIACANVAGLLLAQTAARSREFALRAALGAARSRLVAQLLAESLLLSAAGGLVGFLLAASAVRAIPAITAFQLPRSGEIHLDWPVLLFASALSVGTGILFGLLPSLAGSRPDLMAALRSAGAAASGSATQRPAPFTMRSALVAGQAALSIVLLVGATLLIESVAHLRHVDLGFNSSGLLTLRISLPPSRYDTDSKKSSFFENLLARVNSSPGVQSATAAMFLPMTGFVGSPAQDADKPRLKLNERPIVTLLIVAPDYFHTLGVSLRRGRDFSIRDRDGSQPVAVVDESCARRFWPAYPHGEDPIGKRLLVGGLNRQPVQVVGIVADVHQNLENTAWPATVYLPFAQAPQGSAMLAVRTRGDALSLSSVVRRQVWTLDKNQPISAVETMDDLLEQEVGQRRLIVNLLGGFASVALLLALIGIYGVVSYTVEQRIREIGVRRALGAGRADVLRLVLGQGLALACTGVAVGLCAAFLLTHVIQHLLFHVSTTDAKTFAGVAILFTLVCLAASSIPAARAIRIDPAAALRVE